MEEAIYKKIELFLSGEMSKEETLQFEKSLQENEELKSEVALYKAINLHMSENDDESISNSTYKEKLKAYRVSKEGEEAENKLLKVRKAYHSKAKETNASNSKNKVIYFIISTAAIIAFLIGVFIYQNKDSNEELYAKHYSSKELPSFVDRSDIESVVLILALENFHEKKYKLSLSNFNDYLTESEEINPLIYIYTSVAQSELGNLEKAISELGKLEILKIEDSSRALWYKALIYLKFEKEAKAKEVLSKIIDKESNYKFKEAKELYEAL